MATPTIRADQDPRWPSIAARAAAADGSFWYSVRSMGVYCRPSCPARLPNPRNVAFHATPAAARAAGFRACKRCRPDEPRELVRHALAQGPLGLVLVATGERGIRAILLGDEPGALLRDLTARFPRALLVSGDAAAARTAASVAAWMERPLAGLDLPLDPRGTAFQQQVWQALRRVPAGRTASYGDIARQIGAPGAARAVAAACAANPLAVAVPCHRVVRGDGSLSGYRWGLERKRALLAAEARA